MTQYNTGTVSVTNGNSTITGSGTTWTGNISVGDEIIVDGHPVYYTIASVVSDTSLTISGTYQGATASGKIYAIDDDFSAYMGLRLPQSNDLFTAEQMRENATILDGHLTPFIDNDWGKHLTEFDVSLVGAAWESVGPTGSGATNIWTALNNVPSYAKRLICKAYNSITDTSGTETYQEVYARKNGATAGPDIDSLLFTNVLRGASGYLKSERTEMVYIPVDGSLIFELYRTILAESSICRLYLVDFK